MSNAVVNWLDTIVRAQKALQDARNAVFVLDRIANRYSDPESADYSSDAEVAFDRDGLGFRIAALRARNIRLAAQLVEATENGEGVGMIIGHLESITAAARSLLVDAEALVGEKAGSRSAPTATSCAAPTTATAASTTTTVSSSPANAATPNPTNTATSPCTPSPSRCARGPKTTTAPPCGTTPAGCSPVHPATTGASPRTRPTRATSSKRAPTTSLNRHEPA